MVQKEGLDHTHHSEDPDDPLFLHQDGIQIPVHKAALGQALSCPLQPSDVLGSRIPYDDVQQADTLHGYRQPFYERVQFETADILFRPYPQAQAGRRHTGCQGCHEDSIRRRRRRSVPGGQHDL